VEATTRTADINRKDRRKMGLNIFIIVSALWFGWLFGLYSRGLLTAQLAGSCFRAAIWVPGQQRPESIEAFCVGVLDGGKVQAVGWLILLVGPPLRIAGPGVFIRPNLTAPNAPNKVACIPLRFDFWGVRIPVQILRTL
jgi:hypothetical protein